MRTFCSKWMLTFKKEMAQTASIFSGVATIPARNSFPPRGEKKSFSEFRFWRHILKRLIFLYTIYPDIPVVANMLTGVRRLPPGKSALPHGTDWTPFYWSPVDRVSGCMKVPYSSIPPRYRVASRPWPLGLAVPPARAMEYTFLLC